VHLIWKALFSSVCSSTREHFNKLTPQIRVRTVQKPKPALLARPQLAPVESEEKQWIVTPSNLLAKLKFTTINKVGLLKRDPEFMQASSRLMQGWTQNLNSLIGTLLKQADFHSFTEEASYWRDSERVLGLVLEELTDINVAKLDSILTGSREHKLFKNSVAKIKNYFKQAKVYNAFYSNLATQLLSLDLMQLPECFASINAASKLIQSKAFDEASRTSVLLKVVDFVIRKIGAEIDFNGCFRNRNDAVLRKIRDGFDVLLRDSLDKSSRPRTAMTTSSSSTTRPSTAASTSSESYSLAEVVHHYTSVSSDFCQMLNEYKAALHRGIPQAAELIRVYEHIKPEFDIWAKHNCLKWELLKKNFYTRLRPGLEMQILDSEEDDVEGNEVKWEIS